MKRVVFVMVSLATLVAIATLTACSRKTPIDPTPVNEVFYTALGASDVTGFGSSVPCLPYTDCIGGTGYVPVIVRRLQAAGKTVTLMNLGIPTAVLSPEVQAIGASLGRDILGNFLDQEGPFVPRNTTLVTVFAGGNDANAIGAAVGAGLGGADPAGFVGTETRNFGRDLRALVAMIRGRAPQARIVFLNLPNLAGLPYARGYSLDQRRGLQQIAVGFSAEINALTSQGILVIDLMCDSRFYQPSFFSNDGFHPNDAGYAYLAEVSYSAASTGSGAAPRSSCSEMTLF